MGEWMCVWCRKIPLVPALGIVFAQQPLAVVFCNLNVTYDGSCVGGVFADVSFVKKNMDTDYTQAVLTFSLCMPIVLQLKG